MTNDEIDDRYEAAWDDGYRAAVNELRAMLETLEREAEGHGKGVEIADWRGSFSAHDAP